MAVNSKQVNNFLDAPSLPDPGFYSNSVSVNGAGRMIYTSGQLGQYSDGSFPERLKDQYQQAFANLEIVLRSAGASIRDLTKLTFYCVDWNYEEGHDFLEPLFAFLTDQYGIRHRPLTTLVPVPKLADPRAKFEVEAVAAIGGLSQIWSSGQESIQHVIPPMETDVVVIGGGFSGLQAAFDLQKAGLSCLVLEAKSRIGGRSHTHRLASGNGLVELGATWINKKTQPKIYALTQRFGLECVPQYEIGESIWQDSNTAIWRVKRDQLPLPPDEKDPNMLYQLLEKMESEQTHVDINQPENYPAPSDVSVEDWLQRENFSPFSKDFMRLFVSALVGCEARDLSLHYIMDYIKSGGGYLSLSSEGEDGAQSLKIKQGTSAIAAGLAGELKPGSIILNSPVDQIRQYGGKCTVYTSTGLVVNCKKTIIAIPTNTYENIQFSPPLPSQKRAIVSRTKPGIYAKVILTYAKPWWREIGLVGTFNSTKGPICFSWDISDPNTSNYSLVIFIAGDAAASWHQLSRLRREEAVVNHLAELVGAEHALLAQDVLEINQKEWTKEEFLGGAPTSAMGVGELARHGKALREVFLHTHFGGSETAFEWKGYMEGALRAGSRVAAEVVRELVPDAKL